MATSCQQAHKLSFIQIQKYSWQHFGGLLVRLLQELAIFFWWHMDDLPPRSPLASWCSEYSLSELRLALGWMVQRSICATIWICRCLSVCARVADCAPALWFMQPRHIILDRHFKLLLGKVDHARVRSKDFSNHARMRDSWNDDKQCYLPKNCSFKEYKPCLSS